MPLKRPLSQQLQEESFNAIHKIINDDMNCQFRSLTPDNSGIDCEIELVERGNMSAKLIKGQIKAGKSYIYSENERIIKVRLEKKYLDHWKAMNLPVILFFYHPDTKKTYWKSIKEYLIIEPKLLKKLSETIVIPFDKDRDLFSASTYEKFKFIIEGSFKYEKYIFSKEEKEKIWSNWFPVESIPEELYEANVIPSKDSKLNELYESEYIYIVKSNKIITFINLQDNNHELRSFIDISSIRKIKTEILDKNYLVELLNKIIIMNLIKRDLQYNGEKFYFKREVLKEDSSNIINFAALRKEQESSRKKITVIKQGDEYEFSHLACKLHFNYIKGTWYLELEPDVQFSYSKGSNHSRREIGIRITQMKASMYNQEYLYLMHFWREFLANSNNQILFSCDFKTDEKIIAVNKSSLNCESDFQIFNDYNKVVKQ